MFELFWIIYIHFYNHAQIDSVWMQQKKNNYVINKYINNIIKVVSVFIECFITKIEEHRE